MEEIPNNHLGCIPKPCKSCDKPPPTYQLVSLPDFWSINHTIPKKHIQINFQTPSFRLWILYPTWKLNICFTFNCPSKRWVDLRPLTVGLVLWTAPRVTLAKITGWMGFKELNSFDVLSADMGMGFPSILHEVLPWKRTEDVDGLLNLKRKFLERVAVILTEADRFTQILQIRENHFIWLPVYRS